MPGLFFYRLPFIQEGLSMEKNNSRGKPYYSQRNNVIKPGSACNVTTMINGLSSAGWPIEKTVKKGEQPEDALMRFILSDPVCAAEWKRIDPKGKYAPNEWHSILARGTNRWLCSLGDPAFSNAGNAVLFTEYTTARAIADHILTGGTVGLSGDFPLPGKDSLHHMICAVGVKESDDPKAGVKSFTIDDSWGDYHSGYSEQNGNDIELPIEDFKKIIKFVDSDTKMAHFIRKYS
jgi:hypothetical protein